jgi:hypothetical protein
MMTRGIGNPARAADGLWRSRGRFSAGRSFEVMRAA